jgi:hypothetical protein
LVIQIDDSVVEYINSNIAGLTQTSSEILALNNLATTYREGKHILIGSLKVLENLKELKLLDDSARRVYHNLWSRFVYLNTYKKFEDRILVVDRDTPFCRSESESQCIFKVPITHFERLDRSDTTRLVCEDLSDCQFFIALAQKYVDEHREDFEVRISFRPVNGGGNNTYRMYEHEIQNDFIVLGIADSDREFPQSSVGATLRSMRNVYSRYCRTKIVGLFELEVREKENLISPSLYLLGANSSLKSLLHNLARLEDVPEHAEKLKYLDMKDGLKAGTLKANSNAYAYYKDLFQDVADLISCSIEDIFDLDDDYAVIEGLGTKLIDDFIQNVLNGGLEKKLQTKKTIDGIPPEVIAELENNIEKKNRLFENVPQYLRDHLESLCRKIIYWGCCHEILST